MLSLILPTFNEAQNLPSLVELLASVLVGTPHEIIIVDDNSPDGTWRVAQMLAERQPFLRVVRRIGRRGLSSAVVDGFDAATGDVLAVMDADGQHDVALVLSMLGAITGGADVVIGSRYMPGGSVGAWVRDRRIISRIGTFLCNRLSVAPVTDPLSGFFVMRRSLFQKIRTALRPTGFKILLEILAHVPEGARVTEQALVFRPRLHGESKLSWSVHFAFVLQVARLAVWRLCRASLRSLGPVFWAAVLTASVLLLPRAWSLRTLLMDASTRGAVSAALRIAADRQGWLLSDIQLTSVTREAILLTHQSYRRVASPSVSCSLRLHPPVLACDDR